MNEIPFRIQEIVVENFRVENMEFPQEGEYDVETKLSFGVDFECHIVKNRIEYSYIYNNVIVMSITVTCNFDVKPDKFNAMIKDDAILIDEYFLRYLATINVGAARGEIHARCEAAKSAIMNMILPPINLVEAITEPITIKK